jgi:hypothetical protein
LSLAPEGTKEAPAGIERERPLVLVVAMPDSIHTARCLAALRSEPIRLVLVPATPEPPAPELGPTVPVGDSLAATMLAHGAIGIWAGHPDSARTGLPDSLPPPIDLPDRRFLLRAAALVTAIRALRPALLHSMEVQHAGYTCLEAARIMGAAFPRWLVSNWGSDFQLYRKLAAHRPFLQGLVRRMNGYIGECARDLRIVRELGYVGEVALVLPASCGADFTTLAPLSRLPRPSTRTEILIKGYHGWSGRALHVLSAVHLAAPRLARYRIRIALAGRAVADMAEMLQARDGLDVTLDSYAPSHESALARVAAARMTVGIGISDGIGTTTLEAMALGSFPIASSRSCVNEWLRPGRDGLIVDPHDVAALAEALALSATNDALVDAAAPRNRAEVELRWNVRINGRALAEVYHALAYRAARPAQAE